MLTTTTPERWPDFQQDLLAIRNDPEVKSLALRRARDPDVAEDALQTAYCAVARVANPDAIRDLRAYFCRVLLREVCRLPGQLGAALMENFTSVADVNQRRPNAPLPVPQSVAETVSTHLLTEAWLEPFVSRRVELTASVPGRSSDHARYRDVVVTAAERVLCRIIITEISDADYNVSLRAAYPEWFDEPDCAENTRHQRFRRAREDVRALLRTIINRDDLNP